MDDSQCVTNKLSNNEKRFLRLEDDIFKMLSFIFASGGCFKYGLFLVASKETSWLNIVDSKSVGLMLMILGLGLLGLPAIHFLLVTKQYLRDDNKLGVFLFIAFFVLSLGLFGAIISH